MTSGSKTMLSYGQDVYHARAPERCISYAIRRHAAAATPASDYATYALHTSELCTSWSFKEVKIERQIRDCEAKRHGQGNCLLNDEEENFEKDESSISARILVALPKLGANAY